MSLKILNELRSERDFRNEQNDGLTGGERLMSEREIDISFARAGDAMEEDSIGRVTTDSGESVLLSSIERDGGRECLAGHGASGLMGSATLFSNTARQHSLDNGGHWATVVIG